MNPFARLAAPFVGFRSHRPRPPEIPRRSGRLRDLLDVFRDALSTASEDGPTARKLR